MKLALGSAQFGLNYGISNSLGQVNALEVSRILVLAQQHHINLIDTAAVYGESEKVLGHSGLCKNFALVSKIPALRDQEDNVAKYIENSLANLNINQLDSVLFHRVDDVISSPLKQTRFNHLMTQKQLGKVKKIGVSVYTPAQLSYCFDHYPLDVVQLPFNLLDQRFLHTGWLDKLKKSGIEIHCRSVFLQGLLFMEKSQLDDYFNPYLPALEKISQKAKALKIPMITLALAIVCQQSNIDKIIVGCCNKTQLHEIIMAYHDAKKISDDLTELAFNDEQLLIPSFWPQG